MYCTSYNLAYGIERGVYVIVPISHTLHTESIHRNKNWFVLHQHPFLPPRHKQIDCSQITDLWNKAQALVYVVFSVRVSVTYSYVIIRSYKSY